MSELTALTIADARAGLKQKKFSAARACRRASVPRSRRRARSTPMCWRRRSGRCAMAKAADARIAKGDAGPLEGIPLADQGHVLHRGRAHHGLLAHPRQFRADLQVDGDRQSLARWRGDARQDQQRRVRHGLVERDLVHGPGDLAVAAQGRQHAAGAGRLVGRLGGGGGGASVRSARPAPTPAARSASRRRSPASSASSRPTAAARAGASWRSRPRSTRPGRSRARCATAAILLRSMAGPRRRRTRPRSICRCRTTKPRSASRSRA